MNVSIVPVSNVDAIWPHIAERVTRCLRKAPSEMSTGDFWSLCRSGNAFLIVALDGEDITAVTVWRFTAFGYFECMMIEGRGAGEWLKPVLDCALKIADDHGLNGIVGIGRTGWAKLVKKHFPKAKIPRQMYTVEIER